MKEQIACFLKSNRRCFIILAGILLVLFGAYQIAEMALPEQWDIVAVHSDDPIQVRDAVIMLGGEYAKAGRQNPELEAVFKKLRERTAIHMSTHMTDKDMTVFNQWKDVWSALNTATGKEEPFPVRVIQLGGF